MEVAPCSSIEGLPTFAFPALVPKHLFLRPEGEHHRRSLYAYFSFNALGRAGILWGSTDTLAFAWQSWTNIFSLYGRPSPRILNESNKAVAATSVIGDDKHAKPELDLRGTCRPVRIAVIGGGIAGVTAASAIASRLAAAKIVVFEADSNANYPYQVEGGGPKWTAATARNANSIVPGSSMHVMSQRSVLRDVVKDTVYEWFLLHIEKLTNLKSKTFSPSFVPQLRIDNFEHPPPYFAFHLLRCIGHHASSEERWTFVTFLRHFLLTALMSGHKEADDRALHMMQLAKANRAALLQEFERSSSSTGGNPTQLGIGKGFLGLHRTAENAKFAVAEAVEYGEEAEILPWAKAVELEPHIANLPFGPLHVVHRPNDYTANCLRFVQKLKSRCKKEMKIDFRENESGAVVHIEPIYVSKAKDGGILHVANAKKLGCQGEGGMQEPGRFRIFTADGLSYESDYLILAAGVNTPLLARQMGAGKCCPTYPMRGFSLTVNTGKPLDDKMKGNLMNRAVSVDSMFCSSVGSNMARIAGYGEFVGYRECAKDVPSVGPSVLARYAKALFPNAIGCGHDSAIQCFRPMSPDDIPLAGMVGSVPGLAIHTGHGTLGWTLSLSTAECLAQAIYDDVNGEDESETFELPDKTKIRRKILSPDRFV